jgi:hypothetical protein
MVHHLAGWRVEPRADRPGRRARAAGAPQLRSLAAGFFLALFIGIKERALDEGL